MWPRSRASLALVAIAALSACDASRSGPACDGGADCPSSCGPGVDSPPYEGAQHVAEPTPVHYNANPPASGSHWPNWQEPWDDYPQELPRERWVHNTEHGGVVLLYNCPSGCEDVHQQLVAIRNGTPANRYNTVRILVTPDSVMPHKVAAVAWLWRWQGDAVDADAIKCFIQSRYDHAPESLP